MAINKIITPDLEPEKKTEKEIIKIDKTRNIAVLENAILVPV